MRALLLLCLVPAGLAFAQTDESARTVETNGYLDSRTSYSRARTWGLLPTEDLPQRQELLELNAQVRMRYTPRSFVYGDLSLVGNWGADFRGLRPDGTVGKLEDHATPQAQPLVSLNELYLLHEFFPALNLTLGKKRIVWGPGFAVNPTDLMNARRDPTDPTFQRSGVWLAQLEVPLEVMTFSFVFAPTQTRTVVGLPTHLLYEPSWDKSDDEAHYQLAARAYALVAQTDVNLMLFWGNKYNDAFADKFRVGASFSRYIFDATELHGEALVQQGSSRDFLVASCLESTLAALRCSQQKRDVVVKRLLDDRNMHARALLGLRHQFDDETMVSFEYLYQSDGWTKDDFQAFANGLDLYDQARRAGISTAAIPGVGGLLGGGAQDGLPVRFSFDPRAQHYLFATFQKPRIKDDFTASVMLIANLQDLSTMWTPSLAWSTTEWLTLTLWGYLPVKGPDALAPKTPSGAYASEYGGLPFEYRVLFEARAFF